MTKYLIKANLWASKNNFLLLQQKKKKLNVCLLYTSSLKWELEDLSFKYLEPEEYHELVEGINKKREERLQFIEKIMNDIRVCLLYTSVRQNITALKN